MSRVDFRDHVKEKLKNSFGKSFQEQDDLSRVLYFLDKQDSVSGDAAGTAVCPYWKSLSTLLDSDRAFKNFAQRLADDTKTAEENPKFLRVMHDMYGNGLTYSETPLPVGLHQGFDLRLANVSSARKLVVYSLAAVYLNWEAYQSIKRWWRGEISGKRCAKNVIDATATTAAGVAGGLGGAALGTVLGGPIGAVFGALVGGIAAGSMANILSFRLTQWIFAVPKSEALENAYNYLNVKSNATNAEVNTAFRKLCLKHHPDKGGNEEEFFILQNYMVVIKMARGDM